MKSKVVKFPEFAPDLTPIDTGVAEVISGCVPRSDGYGPFKSLNELTAALPAACRGFYFARRTNGAIAVFAGTATGLYLLDNTTLTWGDVSKSGSPYSTLITDDNWQFDQFNDVVIAVQSNTVPQAFTLASSSEFANLGGSPPQASHVAVINRFVVLSGLLSNPNRVQWCDLDNIIEWTAGVGLADYQDLPDGGRAHGLSGGDSYGLVFQDQSIRSLTYAPGSAVTFQITRIAVNDPLFAQYSVVNVGDKTFFCSAQGFKRIDPGGRPVSIGKERVDRYFFDDVDRSNLQLVIGATDPTATRVYWAYKSIGGNAGLFDKVLCYDWSIGETGRWSLLFISGQFLANLAKPGLTLEQLDAVAPTQIAITGAADNGAGLIRLTVTALSNANFNIAGQNFIVVQGVLGTTEANGTWAFSVVDSTHIDLTGSTFANAYVSGGAIGGSLDALPFSLDSVSTAAIAQLAAFDSDNKLGFFDGANLEAIVETSEQQNDGEMTFISGLRPITDASAAVASIGWRQRPIDALTYSDEKAIGSFDGVCPQHVEARYARGRLRIPAGSTWTYARGLQPHAQPAGEM